MPHDDRDRRRARTLGTTIGAVALLLVLEALSVRMPSADDSRAIAITPGLIS